MEVFPPMVVGALKPSIMFRSLSSLQLAPVHSSSLPSSLQLTPARSSSLPSSLQLAPQFAPAHSPVCSSSLPPSPIAPYTPQVVGTPTHIWPFGARWSRLGVSWSKLGAGTELGASWSELGAGSELEQADFGPMVGTYKGLLWLCEWTLGGDFTSRWWGHISRICHNGSWSKLGAGASWE